MEKDILQFGNKKGNIEYISRPGVYGIILQQDGLIAVVKVHNKYYLIGGGLDEGETEEICLLREIMEETGRMVDKINFLGRANQYTDSVNGYFNKIGSFYEVQLNKDAIVEHEETHVFSWVTKEEFKSNAAHEAQVWAVYNLI